MRSATLAASVLALSLAACGDDGGAPPVDAGAADATPDGGADAAAPPVDDPYAPAPPIEPLAGEVVAALASGVDAELDGIGAADISALVLDHETGRELHARAPDRPSLPASNEKLWTTAAAMELLGADHRSSIVALTDGALGAGGALSGDLFVLGLHDSSLSADFWERPDDPLRRLAAMLHDAGLREVPGRVALAGEVVWDGDRFGTYDPAGERAEAADALDAALSAAGISAPPAAPLDALEVPGTRELARVHARPLSVIVHRINDVSHNELADCLARQVGFELAGTSSYAAASGELAAWLASTGVDATGARAADGSGLSYDDRLTARQVVGILRFMLGAPDGQAYWQGLSVAGLAPGTLGSRLLGDDTRGRVFGKTGTLNVAIALSGLLFHRHEGRRIAFSFLVNGLDRSRHAAVRAALDRAVERLAAPLRPPAPRPAAPVLRSVVNEGTGSSVMVRWVSPAPSVLVWLSEDGLVWERARARLVTGSSAHRVAGLAPGQVLHVRVSAVDAVGLGDASDVYAVRVGAGPSPVLLVDGHDRYQGEPSPENPLGHGHAFLSRWATALQDARGGAPAFDSVANEELVAGAVALERYAAVLWQLGEESTADATFDAGEQALVRAYLGGGGALLVSGAEVGWDLVERGDAADRAFHEETLRASFVDDGAGTFLAEGTGGVFAELGTVGFLDPRGVRADFPDVLAPAGGSVEALRYVGGAGGAAAIQHEGEGRLLYFGFPLESIETAEARARLFGAALRFFGF